MQVGCVCVDHTPPGPHCAIMLVHAVAEPGGKVKECTPCTVARSYV